MHFIVAIRVKQHLVSNWRLGSAFRAPNYVMAVPSGYFGDLLLADWTEAVLGFPQVEQPLFAFQAIFHLHIQAMFKIGFPFRVIGISNPFYLDMSLLVCMLLTAGGSFASFRLVLRSHPRKPIYVFQWI